MPLVRVDIECNFVGEFKVGDNLAYNCDVLFGLVAADNNGSFSKPILIQLASIVEASLNEIIKRAQQYVREGVPNITAEEQAEIVEKKIDKLNSLIDVSRKYRILNGISPTIYEDLHVLRKLRNKIHIQEDVDGFSRDENRIFTRSRHLKFLEIAQNLLAHLSQNYSRPKGFESYVRPIAFPRWEP